MSSGQVLGGLCNDVLLCVHMNALIYEIIINLKGDN